jgi:hypothetical protein
VVLAVATALIPLPALAAEDARPSPKPGSIKASVEKIDARALAPARPTRANEARRAAQGTTGRDTSFFKSKPGILVLAVMAVGTGYALYSTQHDRITSPAKK